MKILWLTIDRSHRVAQHFNYFKYTVSKFADVTVVEKCPIGDKGQNAWYISHKLMSGETKIENVVLNHLEKCSDYDYDFIFCDAFFAYIHEPWKKFGIPSAIFIEDVHGPVPKAQIKIAKDLGIKTIFHRFSYAFHKHHPRAKFDFKCIWLPHSIKMNRFSDEIEKSIGVLHIGIYTRDFYPNRRMAVKLLENKSYFKRVKRPRDRAGTLRSSKWPIDKDYDNLLQSSWICVTGGSKINAPVHKYVEIPASGSLLMSNWFSDLGMLGFQDEVNMVSYSKENLIERVEDLLNDKDEIKRISDKGRQLILNNHTSEIRTKQFINYICQIVDRPLEFPDVETCSHQVCFSGQFISKRKRVVINTAKRSPQLTKKIIPGTDWRSRIAASRQL